MEEKKVFKLTGQEISDEMQKILAKLEKGQYVPLEEIDEAPEVQLARTHIAHSVETIRISGREAEQNHIREKLDEMGSASGALDENGEMIYNGIIKRESRLDIVIGLPASGKSSAVVDVLSQEFQSRVIDNDKAKEAIPEFNNGWGAGVVHRESQKISHKQLELALEKHENIVLPKVGSDTAKMQETIKDAKDAGYSVYLHYVELDRNKALGRMLGRFLFGDGRFLDPALADKYCNAETGNKVEKCYETLKKGGDLDGYSKWNNDVKRGERPVLVEAACDGEFIRNARRDQAVSADLRDHGKGGRSMVQGNKVQDGTSGRMEQDELGGEKQDHRSDLCPGGLKASSKQEKPSLLGNLHQKKEEARQKNEQREAAGKAITEPDHEKTVENRQRR